MKKNKTKTVFEKLNEQNFKIVSNTDNITGGGFHLFKTWRRKGQQLSVTLSSITNLKW